MATISHKNCENCTPAQWLQSVTKIVRLAPLPTYLIQVASLLAHSLPPLPGTAFTGLA